MLATTERRGPLSGAFQSLAALSAVAALVMHSHSLGQDPVGLFGAAESGNVAMVKTELQRGVDVNTRDNVFGLTALHYAAHAGHREVAQFLLDAGANVNVTSRQADVTPLHIAVCQGHIDVVELLVEKGAHVNAADDRGYTPLDMAVKRIRLAGESGLMSGHGQERYEAIAVLLQKHGGKTGKGLRQQDVK